MKKKIKYTILSLSLLLFAGLTISASQGDFALGRNVQILFNMFRELSLFYVDEIDSDQMLEDAATGMVSKLDPYTVLIPEKEMAEFEIMTTGKYGGMGATVRTNGDYTMIAEVYKGFPADKAGLVIGDILMEVNGQDLKGFEVAQVSALLKGTPGTPLELKVKRLLTNQIETVSFKRERISISGVPYYGMLTDRIGYIVHRDFTEDCSKDIHNAIINLKKQGATSLVFDLRNNGGGILQEAVKVLSMFVPKGTEVVQMRGRIKEMDAVFRTQNEPIDTETPLIVLVNSSSASAAELVAGALQDLDRAVLVGQRTFGKGLVQSTRPLGFNSYLKLTTAKYYIPSGRCVQAIDYAHRAEDGSVKNVPDSLIQEFHTSNGRKVYDGGGVIPDVSTEPRKWSAFTIALYSKEYISDFANEYYKLHRGAFLLDQFTLSDSDYQSFTAYMADKPVDFESETKLAVEELRKKAEQDKYLDRIQGELSAIEEKLKEDKATDLELFKSEISQLLGNEIIMRYAYTQGVISSNAKTNPDVLKAIELLQDSARYNHILSQQDTPRN